MEVTALLADAVSIHPDQTFSLLRGGIDRVMSAKAPILFSGAFFIRLLAEAGESGKHTFEVRLMNQDGKEVAPRLGGQIEVPAHGGSCHMVLNCQLTLPEFGPYTFLINVDSSIHRRWSLTALQVPQAGGPNIRS